LPSDVASIIFATALILFMTGEKRSHPLDSGKAYATAASQVASPGHTASNALLAGFLRR